MNLLIGKTKKFAIAVKKNKEKLFFNIVSILRDD